MVCEEVSWGRELMAPWMVSKSESQRNDDGLAVPALMRVGGGIFALAVDRSVGYGEAE
jgi:hypothetical protein